MRQTAMPSRTEDRRPSRSQKKQRLMVFLPSDEGLRDTLLAAEPHVASSLGVEVRYLDSSAEPLAELAAADRQQVENADLLLCSEEMAPSAADFGIPLVAVFLGTLHYEVLGTCPDHCTVVYPNLPTCPGSMRSSGADLQGALRAPELAAILAERLAGPQVGRVKRLGQDRKSAVSRLSVIVSVCLRRAGDIAWVEKCLQAVHSQATFPHEIIVVCSQAEVGIPELKSAAMSRLLFAPGNTSIAGLWNVGAKHAAGDVFMFLHQDQIVQRGWDTKLVRCLKGDVALAGTEMCHFTPSGDLHNGSSCDQREFIRVCGMAIRRDVFRQLGGIDQELGPTYPEAADLCFRAHRIGYRLMHLTDRAIEHTGSVCIPRADNRLADGAKKLMRKWPDRFDPVAAPELIPCEPKGPGEQPTVEMPDERPTDTSPAKLQVPPVAISPTPPTPAPAAPPMAVPASTFAPAITTYARPDDVADWQTVVMLSGCTWSCTGGGQRPVQLSRALARRGCQVIYCGMHDLQQVGWAPGIVACNHHDLRLLMPWLQQVRGTAMMCLPLPSVIEIAQELANCGWRVIYDCIDDWEAFAQAGYWMEYHEEWEARAVSMADVVTASAKSLCKKVKRWHPKQIMHLPNAGGLPALKRRGSPPPDLVRGEQGTAIYVGSVEGPWLDWGLTAEARPLLERRGITINIIGGITAAAQAAGHCLGEKPMESIGTYLAWSDVALLPFKCAEISYAVDPIKYYDYRAASLRMVGTDVLEELRKRKAVDLVCSDARTFAAAVRRAVAKGPKKLSKKEALTSSWMERAETLEPLLRPGKGR